MFDSFESSPQGELAQLVERCDRTAEVRGSNPLFSIAMMAWPLVLASLPLLQTAQDRIVLLNVGPLQELPSWATATEQQPPDAPATMRVAWTERQEIGGPGRWRVAYGIDCEGRRIRRLSAPMDLSQGVFAKQVPISGEEGFWYPERPFTLLSRLLQQVCSAKK